MSRQISDYNCQFNVFYLARNLSSVRWILHRYRVLAVGQSPGLYPVSICFPTPVVGNYKKLLLEEQTTLSLSGECSSTVGSCEWLAVVNDHFIILQQSEEKPDWRITWPLITFRIKAFCLTTFRIKILSDSVSNLTPRMFQILQYSAHASGK